MLVKIPIDSRELACLLAFFLSFSLPPSPFPLVFLQFCLTICLTNVKLPKVIMEAYQLDTKLSLVYNLVLSLWRIECIVCVCNVYVGVFVSAFVQLQRNCTDVAHVRVRGQHVVALVLFSLDFFHFRFSHSHAFTLALTPSRNIHALYYSLQNINYFHLFIWWIKRIKDGWQVNLSWGRILSFFFYVIYFTLYLFFLINNNRLRSSSLSLALFLSFILNRSFSLSSIL